ncbi:DUF3558 domain-containing protein [Nocardia cyriacigeorgica]|uniref:DUF3558 domain-containing protein n=1 Tax=Nocardia cyriacigeorgica TaxID=135487 RepID=UPI0013BA010D|nr:DUF3558 domain-containing protein [Nocardia cyriacigeorgica]NEW53852.1 DUF3558 domain-containing protein [Nocardia cyriacigeorgica]
MLLAAAVLGVAGCSGSTDGSPTAVESAAASPEDGPTSETGSAADSTSAKPDEAALWDPCALPGSAISSTALDTASKESGIAEVDFSDAGWKICTWKADADWYWLTISSGTPTLDEVKARDDFTEFSDTTVGSRRAVQFRKVGSAHDLRCNIAVEVPQGIVMFAAGARASVGAKEDMCSVAGRHTADLGEYLPEN